MVHKKYSTSRRVIGNFLKRRGAKGEGWSQKPKFFKEMYEPKQVFPKWWGFKPKTPLSEGFRYYSLECPLGVKLPVNPFTLKSD